MLLKDDKKKTVTIIARGASEAPVPVNSAGDEIHSKDAFESAAAAAISAIDSKDKVALASALKNFIELCSYEHESDQENVEE